MSSNLFAGMQRISHPLEDQINPDQQEESEERESPFLGNHVVKTVRNLKRMK